MFGAIGSALEVEEYDKKGLKSREYLRKPWIADRSSFKVVSFSIPGISSYDT
jgi:hypothetical protein